MTKEIKNVFAIEKGILGVQTTKVDENGNVEVGVEFAEIVPRSIISRIKKLIGKNKYSEQVPEDKLNEFLGVPCRNDRLVSALSGR